MAVPALDQMTEDMAKHFEERLRLLVIDTVKTCEIGGVGAQACVALMLATLLKETIAAAGAMDFTENEFAALCREAYQHMFREHGTITQWKKEQKR